MPTLYKQVTSQPTPPVIKVSVEKGDTGRTEFSFDHSFLIGRGVKCDVRFQDDVVSRSHAEIRFENGYWRIYDLESGNGILVNGISVGQAILEDKSRIELGPNGPVLIVYIDQINETENADIPLSDSSEEASLSLTHYKNYYFGDKKEEDMGHHTLMVHRAFEDMQKREKRKYIWIIAGVVCLFIVAGSMALYKHLQISKQKILAENIFYAMKSLELEFADVLEMARTSKNAEVLAHVDTYKTKHKEMENAYDQFVTTLNVYRKSLSQEEQIILKIARIFGECEINMPEGFVREVRSYIQKWKSTDRFEKAIRLAERQGYVTRVANTMMQYDLPPQFFYLALQESNFNVYACGPKTKYGIAKGAWQFIPSTARKYGLRVGPLAHLSKVDLKDDRHHFGKSTLAAARYIRFIYDTDAQASGLLVTASYNWGEDKVIKLIQKMPMNPKERNFWRVLTDNKDKIPKQTYDYVFYIFSAAVIGENPRLFGFDFDNPLALAAKM